MRSLITSAAFLSLAISALATPPVPRQAKEFDFVDSSGKHTLLSSEKGKVVVIQFLYTTCPHCQAMSQMLTKLEKEYGPRGLVVLGAAFNDEANPAVVKAYTGQYAGFPVGVSNRDTVMSYLGLSVLARFVVPQVMIIDKKGEVVGQSDAMGEAPVFASSLPPVPAGTRAAIQNEGYLRIAIEKLLAEGGGAKSTTTSGTSKKSSTKKPASE